MRKSITCLPALAALALGTIDLVGSGQSAAQQGTKAIGFVLFGQGDSVDLQAGSLQKLAAAARSVGPSRGECPRGTITTYAAKGDELFQQALVGARRDAVFAALRQMGVDVSQFYFQAVVSDRTNDTVLTYGAPADETPPTLHTSSQPTNGSKVRKGQQIAVTMVARDDTTLWQTGIRTIELFADSEGGRLVASRVYPPHLPTCEGQPEPHTLNTTYVVPDPPPPIVRLRAVTKDHAGHQDTDTAVFPVGDWQGTLMWRHVVANASASATTTASADVSLEYDGKGGLTGRMVGTHSSTSKMGPCAGTTTPGGIQAKLVGSYTPGRDAMTVRTDDKQITPMHIRISCPGARPVVSQHPGFYEHYERALTGLRANSDGGFESSHDQEYRCEAGSTCTTRITLKLRPAK